MINSFLKLIENKFNVKKDSKFALIIGEKPSSGARSPVLWNKAYKFLNKNSRMYPADVKGKKLKKLVFCLKKEKNFLGCAVTIPYKEKIIPYLDAIDNHAKKIGSVNTIINNSGKLKGFNTDYYGSLHSIKKICKRKKFQKILILGCGGAGKACIISAINYFKNSIIYLHNRNKKKIKNLLKKNETNNLVKIVDNYKKLMKIKKLNLIINTTSIGFDIWKKKNNYFFNFSFFSPLSQLKKINGIKNKNFSLFNKLNKNAFIKNIMVSANFLRKNHEAKIFDIIYLPKETVLIKLSKSLEMETINGSKMNLMQAVEGFNIVNRYDNRNQIIKAMTNNGK